MIPPQLRELHGARVLEYAMDGPILAGADWVCQPIERTLRAALAR